MSVSDRWIDKRFFLIIFVWALAGCVAPASKTASSNKDLNTANANDVSVADQAINAALGETKMGIVECDELFDAMAEQARSPDDNLVSKTAKEYFLNRLRENLKKSIEKNRNDRAKMAEECRTIKTQLEAGASNSDPETAP